MTSNRNTRFLIYFFAIILPILAHFGCASIQRPTGGPRDRTPPKLLKATPPNQTRNFTAKTIRLDFDEYFKLVSQYQEITVSPVMEKSPEYTIKEKSLVIKLKDTLSKNTTYVINFGKAIADVNEGNILKNFTYVFSSGPQIDSLSITGNVSNIENVQKEKDVTVMIYPLTKDTAYYGKKKPAIYTTTDTAGNFRLGNLKGGDYTIYALKETSPNKIYDNDDELIGFTKNPIHLTKDTGNVQLKLFKQIPLKLRATNRRIDQDGKLFFTFNKSIEKPSVKILDPKIDSSKIVDFNKTADTAIVYLRSLSFDSVKVSFLENGKALDTLTLRRSKKDTYKRRIELQYNTSGEALKPGTDLTIIANYPIGALNNDRLTLVEDSVGVENFKLITDPANRKKFILKYPWKQDRIYDIVFSEAAFVDIYGDKNVKLTKRIALDKPENYTTLTLKVTLPDTGKDYIVELLTADGRLANSLTLTNSKAIVYKNYAIGKYKVKVIYDANKNGKWDTGNVKQKIQPENIWLYPKEITLRSNFDIEEPLAVPKEQLTP